MVVVPDAVVPSPNFHTCVAALLVSDAVNLMLSLPTTVDVHAAVIVHGDVAVTFTYWQKESLHAVPVL